MSRVINNNGIYIEDQQPVVTARNRSFRYGDALFESVRISNSRPQFLKEHMQRLFAGMKVLKMEMHHEFSETFFEHALLDLVQKNGIASDARARITVYRNDGGLYTPDDNTVSYLIEVNH